MEPETTMPVADASNTNSTNATTNNSNNATINNNNSNNSTNNNHHQQPTVINMAQHYGALENLFNTSTLKECESMFAEHFEDHYELFAHSDARDKLTLLRICVDLLNRLDDTTHHLFAGRVLIFLARTLGLFDQSGLNFKSELNNRELPSKVVENLEKISKQNMTADHKGSSQMMDQDMEEGETISDDESNDETPKDDSDKIYERFWKVQQLMCQPNLLHDKNNWHTFRTCVDTLVCKLEQKPAHLRVWTTRQSFMTRPRSLLLQLSDINMRRCFLVQILITNQYLDSSSQDSKPETITVDKVQQAWFSTITKRIFALLDTMPNQEEGRKFLGLIRQVLRREEMWVKWKGHLDKNPRDKCREPKLNIDEDDMINMRGTYHKRRKLSDELSAAKAYNMHVIGSQDMSRLWNMKPTNESFKTPDIDQYLNIPEEKQSECFKDPNHSFRVLRLLRKSPHFFAQSSAPILSLDEYLKMAASRYNNSNNNKQKT